MSKLVQYHITADADNLLSKLGQAQLRMFEYIAANQDQAVLSMFRAEKRPMSASEVHSLIGFTEWPLTSIRRSMSNLAKAGKLEKMKETKEGAYGRPEHYYRAKFMSQRKEIT